MAELKLVMACDAPGLSPLNEGSVRFDKLEIEIQLVPPRRRHEKMAQSVAFDICEYSLIDYLNGFDHGLPFTAIPVFPYRVFRHRDIWASQAVEIEEAGQLNNKSIGIQSWVNTAGVWQRGILRQEYGVNLASIEWVRDVSDHGERRRPPAWARIRDKPQGRTLEQVLAKGELAALMLPRPLELLPEDSPYVRRLFPDYAAVEQEYHSRTGLFPIMHVLVIKNALLGDHPWLARSVFEGAQQALDHFVKQQRLASGRSLVWPEMSWAAQERHLGPNPWPGGVKANEAELKTLVDCSLQQGIISRKIRPEELFQLNGQSLVSCA